MKKIIAVLITIIICLGCLVSGCGNEPEYSEDTIVVSVYNAGYGTEWVDNLCNAFASKKASEGEKVSFYIKKTMNAGESVTQVMNGKSINDVDIFFDEASTYLQLSNKKLENGQSVLADLTDVYNFELNGKLIKDGMYDSIENSFNYNNSNKYYSFPSLNDTNGLFYNATIFKDNNISVPRTTDELVEVCEKIRDNTGVYPFLFFSAYWNYIVGIWWAQYETLEEYCNFFNPDFEYEPDDENSYYQKQMGGRESSLTILEKLTNSKKSEKNVNGTMKSFVNPKSTKGFSFTEIQSYFLLGEAAMIPNGGWLYNEMKDEKSSYDIRIMKVPVNSFVASKLGITDSQMREIISYIDGEKTTCPTGYSDETIEAVRKARSLNSSSNAQFEPILVPSYTDKLDIIKEFLVYTCTDEANQIKFKTNGVMPFMKMDVQKLAYDNIDSFMSSKLEIMKLSTYQIVPMSLCNSAFYYANALQLFNKFENRYPAALFSAPGEHDKKTVSQILSEEQTFMKSQWNYYVTEAKKFI